MKKYKNLLLAGATFALCTGFFGGDGYNLKSSKSEGIGSFKVNLPYVKYEKYFGYVDTNVKGTLNICQAALDNKVKRIIHTSTSEVYGTAQYVPIDEKHPLQAQSPYSASKIAADAMAISFFNAFDLPLTIARPFNTYGPRQSARKSEKRLQAGWVLHESSIWLHHHCRLYLQSGAVPYLLPHRL